MSVAGWRAIQQQRREAPYNSDIRLLSGPGDCHNTLPIDYKDKHVVKQINWWLGENCLEIWSTFQTVLQNQIQINAFPVCQKWRFFLSTKMCVHVKLSITSCWFISCPIIFSVPCIDKWTHYNIPVKYRAFSRWKL